MSDEFSPRNFRVAVNFFPPVSMVQSNAVALASELAARTPLTDIHWSATIMTLPDEQTKISVELDGSWHGPTKWDRLSETVIEKLTETENYLKTHVRRFLEHFRGHDNGQNQD